MDRGVGHAGRARVGLGGDAVGGVRNDHRDEQMPYGVDTIRLRIEWPAAPVSRGYNGRAWKMRPLRGWTGGQAADVPQPDNEAVAPPTLPISGSDTMKTQRGQAFDDGLAHSIRFSPDAQHSQGGVSGAPFTQQAELSGRSDSELFRVEPYQTAADQALAALAAVNALPIGQRFAANSPKNTATEPKTNNNVLDIQFTTNYKYACSVLGIDGATAREAIHTAKRRERLGATDNCTFDLKNGDILWQGETIGNFFGD